ncbi:MAG: Asp-tRNA(Asn)/Glu-tRNA(Gln) amidotransferase subunit GatC [Bacteroidota bacterium]|jgi:aspartyl-tRNA(Asn)/glutamyl-tRNA(Gln) amidotransferase subunit C
MEISDKTVRDVAHLARLEFNELQLEKIKNDLNRMLGFVNKLDELNTEGIEPLIYISEESNVLREDVIANQVTQKEALKNAPKKDSDYFKAPKVIDK